MNFSEYDSKNISVDSLTTNKPKQLENYDGLEKIDPITVKINNEELTDERLFYIEKFCHLQFDNEFSQNIDCLINNKIFSIEINDCKTNIKNFPITLTKLTLKNYIYDLLSLPSCLNI